MNESVFYEMSFILLIMFSTVIPVGIYMFLYRKFAISHWAVMAFGMLLVVIAGIDVFLLQFLAQEAKATKSIFDDTIFLGQVSLALYLFPAMFAGLGVNLLSHALVKHLNKAEEIFDYEQTDLVTNSISQQRPNVLLAGAPSAGATLVLTAVLTIIIFVLDLYTGAEIRLHTLYTIPLAILARKCSKLGTVYIGLVVTLSLQVITFAKESLAIATFITEISAVLAASLVIIYLGRISRR